MNLQRGLERVSAAWWGFLSLFAGMAVLGGIFGNGPDRWLMVGMGLAGLVAAYIAHRITCWVVAGFFAPRSQ